MIGYILLGAILTHIFWAAVLVGWWLLLIRKSSDEVQQAVRDDFAAVRNALRRANAPRN